MVDPSALLTEAYKFVAWAMPFEAMHYTFMQRAMVGLLLLAPMCAAMGVQVVNFRMAFFSDAISHSAFTGVALGLLLGADVRLTMIGFGILVGLGIMAVGRRTALSLDAVVGVFFATVVAFGLAVVSRSSGQLPVMSLQAYLLGDILVIGDREILWLSGLFAVLLAFQALGYNRMLYVGLNPSLASAHGVRVGAYQYLFAALLALVVIFCVWAVGVLLVTAMLVVPAAAGRNLARSAGGMFWWSMAVAVSSAVAGLLLSVQDWARTATGATVVLCSSLWFLASAVVAMVRRP